MRKNRFFNILLVFIFLCTVALTGCGNSTVDQLKNDSGIIIEGGSFEKDSLLISEEIKITSDEGKEILEALSNKEFNKEENIYIFDIYVLKDNKKIQPNGKIQVTIPLAEVPQDNVPDYVIFHIKENGEIEELSPVRKNNTLVIEIDSFSYFVVATKNIAHTHNYTSHVTDPTCTEKGYTTYTCNCGDTYIDKYVDELVHSYDSGKVTKEPTHFEEGIKTYTCAECGRTKEESIEKTAGHLFTEWYPSQTEADKHERLCKCGETETGNCTYDSGKVTKEPTHLEEGIKTYTCTECGRTKEESIEKTEGHEFTEWNPSQTEADKHERLCKCGEAETGNCTYDSGKVTKEPTHLEEGTKTYTCAECGRTKEESIEKTAGHEFTEWYPSQTEADKHERLCKCGETETGNCTYDSGKVTKEPTHLEEGTKTYTCTECGRTKEESIEKIAGHLFGEWYPSQTEADKHERLCKCGETETGDCSYGSGKVTKEPTHFEEGIKTYTCTECGRTKEESIEKTAGHEFTEWYPSQTEADKHERLCKCGETETGDCSYDEGTSDKENGLIIYTCTICGREKEEIVESVEGIIIVISGGTATFEGKETVTSDSDLYGKNANVYIAQVNDVLNVSLTNQEGRIFKYWVSGSGTIIPDAEFSMLVLISGYYYPVFEDTDLNDFSSRQKIFEGNCEQGILYMSTNSKGDVKYEVEFENGGHHDFYEQEPFNNQYHKEECSLCGKIVYDSHIEWHSETVIPAGHAEEGQRKCECYCGHVWYESIPVTEEHTVDYDKWDIVEESKDGKYGKYRVHCEYCDYYEEYWYLDNPNLIGFMDNKMINYQYTYGGKVCHDEYYYSYRNAEGQKVYIWAFQYEYETSTNEDYNDTYIFMYIDDENSSTLEPIYLSKSKGDRRAEYLWAIYGYAYDVNDWIKTLDSPDYNIGCGNGMVLSNSMSARSSVFESYHNEWAETYNGLRIPTSKAYNDLSGTPWEIDYEGKSFQGGYYDENGEYVTTGGRDVICYVKNQGTSYKKYMYVDKETGITYGYADYGTYYRTVFIMTKCKDIVSPEEYEALDDAGKSLVYSYGDIEKDIKSLCSKRTAFNNFTLTLPETTTAFRLLFSDSYDCVDISGSNVNVYYNSAYVYNSGSPITFTWEGEEGIAFDRYEIWDFENQKWITLSESETYVFNSLEDPRRTAAYIRVIAHEVEVPVEPSQTFRISVENGYFEIDGKEYYGTIEVAGNTYVYAYANYVSGKTFEYWLDGNGEKITDNGFNVVSDMTLTPVYSDAIYRIYCEGWNYDSYVSVNGGEMQYINEIEGKKGTKFELNTTYDPKYGCNVFLGWYMETYSMNGREFVLISDNQAFTYEITGEEEGCLYAVWTTGENPFIKKYVDIRIVNGFIIFSAGEAGNTLDNAYSAISTSRDGRVEIFDDPTDEIVYTAWDIAYRYELEGEIVHEISESYEDEYDYYPADFWVNNPEYSYPDGEINITGIVNSEGDLEE